MANHRTLPPRRIRLAATLRVMPTITATIVDAQHSPGTHVADFDGSKLAIRTYTYVLQSNGAVLARTMVLVR